MIFDADGEPVPSERPAPPAAVLPIAQAAAALALMLLAAWGAWLQAGAVGLLLLAIALIMRWGAA